MRAAWRWRHEAAAERLALFFLLALAHRARGADQVRAPENDDYTGLQVSRTDSWPGDAAMSTAEIRLHWAKLVPIHCMAIVREAHGGVPALRCGRAATVHHCHGGSMKARGVHKAKGKKTSDWLCIPLCPDHHVGANGVDGTMGVMTWEQRFGAQSEMLDKLGEIMGLDLWGKANAENKVMVPRRELFA